MMLNDTLIDEVMEALIKQGRPSGDGTNCFYRGPEGSKCAAGLLIKDEFYSYELEAKTSDSAIVEEALLKSGVKKEDLPTVSFLQKVHDRADSYFSQGGMPWRKALDQAYLEYYPDLYKED